MTKLSVIITTFNNEETIGICLGSVKWADEIVVLDSFSTDSTLEIVKGFQCEIFQHAFLGYGPQKQMALEKTSNEWVLLLDADEELSPELQTEIQNLMHKGPAVDGYDIPRQEQLFWKMCSLLVRPNYYLRLFNKNAGKVSDMPVHAAPKVSGVTQKLEKVFYHYGERSIHIKIDKINHYSTGLVEDKVKKGKSCIPFLHLLVYPPWVFFQTYLFKRNFLNGWAGVITSITMSFYAFSKYAKLYEHQQLKKHGANLLPPNAPDRKR